jgi:EmrB/QacA subfamily drug resistance transporter
LYNIFLRYFAGTIKDRGACVCYTRKKVNTQQKLVLLISILASFVAFLDGSVVNVALPAIAAEVGGGLTTQQWVYDAYLITLGALMLIAGSLSDLFGRKVVLGAGLAGFALTSLLCAVAPNDTFLIVSRALQGAAGALLVPSSLALIISAFKDQAQGKAIGTWTAWTGIAFVVGPLLGGLLVDAVSWRLIFAINIVPIAVTLWLMRRLAEPEAPQHVKVDTLGAVLGAAGLGGIVYALIEQSNYGWSSPQVYGPLIAGCAAFILFLLREKRAAHPMLPMGIFKVRNFSVGNIATIAIYGGLAVATFLISIFVQQVGGYSALQAGMALLPVTVIMFFLSPRMGALAGKYGPRLFMAAGPMIAALGFLYMLSVDASVAYWTQIFPGILLFGVGLAVTVAPLTAAVLGSIDSRHAGIGSATNNAISRIASLLAVAALGMVTGPVLDLAGFHKGLIATAVLLALGGIISAIGISNSFATSHPPHRRIHEH